MPASRPASTALRFPTFLPARRLAEGAVRTMSHNGPAPRRTCVAEVATLDDDLAPRVLREVLQAAAPH
eukprot:11175436-Lingulodinium_polyedra.AAC.1